MKQRRLGVQKHHGTVFRHFKVTFNLQSSDLSTSSKTKLKSQMLAYFLVFLSVLAFLRLRLIMPGRMTRSKPSTLPRTCSLAVFLGSGTEFLSIETLKRGIMFSLGGHTSEVLKLLSSVDFSRYTPRTYILSEGDHLSAQKAMALESEKFAEGTSHVRSLQCGRLTCQ
jgi:hypothetical protein